MNLSRWNSSSIDISLGTSLSTSIVIVTNTKLKDDITLKEEVKKKRGAEVGAELKRIPMQMIRPEPIHRALIRFKCMRLMVGDVAASQLSNPLNLSLEVCDRSIENKSDSSSFSSSSSVVN